MSDTVLTEIVEILNGLKLYIGVVRDIEQAERHDADEAQRLGKVAGLCLGTLDFQLAELRKRNPQLGRALKGGAA